jgi:hypothetical protein
MPLQLGTIKLTNTSQIVTKDTMLAMMIWAPSGFGKTPIASGLHALTMKFMGKPTLIIGTESGEGGGALTALPGVPLVTPQTHSELDAILTALRSDRQFGGVVLDSSTEAAIRYAKPYALAFPSRERQATRAAGVPERSDYQTMGEVVRQYFQKLINLTTESNPELRKHVVITALEKEEYDDDGKRLVWVGPHLPGAMAHTASAMIQLTASLKIKPEVVPDPKKPGNTIRLNRRVLVTAGDGVRQMRDRYGMLPAEIFMKDPVNPREDEYDLCRVWEELWIPKLVR